MKLENKIVRLTNTRTGKTVSMGIKAATLLSEKYPKEFKIKPSTTPEEVNTRLKNQ